MPGKRGKQAEACASEGDMDNAVVRRLNGEKLGGDHGLEGTPNLPLTLRHL